VLVSLLSSVFAGCGADDKHIGVQEPSPTSTGSRAAPVPDSEIVGAVEVRPGDLPSEFGRENRYGPSGDQVEGQVTLDLCGAEFTSEDLRTARHQVGYGAPDGAVSTETVAYDAEGADLAMTELRNAVASCPRGFFDSKVRGQPALQARFTQLPSEPDWEEDTLALRVRVTAKGEQPLSGAVIYQRRGNVLTAAYAWGEAETSAQLASRIASLLSARLDAAGVATAS
jgi:hypothetical protein